MRFLDTGICCGYYNMALDEAILQLRGENRSPDTLRFYQWDVPTVSTGYFQRVEREINVKYCQEKGYKIVRRPTGGRAVFHNDELTYSFITGKGNPLLNKDVITSYREISRGLLLGLNSLGIPVTTQDKGGDLKAVDSAACFDTPSWYEIVLNGKKLIGSAQTRIKDGLLQHGSLLLSLDLEENLNILNLNQGQREKVRKILKEKATSLSGEGYDFTYEGMKKRLAEKMAENFGLEGYWGELTKEELELAEKLYREKYSQASWNFKK